MPGVSRSADLQKNIFALLSPSQMEIVNSCGQIQAFKKRELLFCQGGRHDRVFIIQSGIVRTFFSAASGRELTFAYWQAGDIVGTPVVLGEGLHQWSGEAVVSTVVMALKTTTLHSLTEQIPEFALGLIQALEFKGKCFSNIVQMLGTMNVSERIVDSLRTLARAHGTLIPQGIVLRTPFTHEAIASMVGASRQWVTMELHNLEKEGMVVVGKRSITVIDLHRLATRA